MALRCRVTRMSHVGNHADCVAKLEGGQVAINHKIETDAFLNHFARKRLILNQDCSCEHSKSLCNIIRRRADNPMSLSHFQSGH
jgi:hypothetical protein